MRGQGAVAIVSGGMDSVTLAYMLADTPDARPLTLVSFNYGQRHRKELEFARKAAQNISAEYVYIDLSTVGEQLKGSALTDSSVDVPEGHYADPNMRITVVPNRNAIMLAVATGIAVARNRAFVATGVHAGDHPVYPDCRPEFILLMSQTMQLANAGFAPNNFTIEAPFVNIGKHEIVKVGMHLRRPVPYRDTWSCYKGGDRHCGKCGTCVERKEAFELAGYNDPTEYDD